MNDSGELSRKKIFKDDDEAVGLLSKNKEPSLPGTLNRQKSDLLLDDLEKAREILQAAISLEPINKAVVQEPNKNIQQAQAPPLVQPPIPPFHQKYQEHLSQQVLGNDWEAKPVHNPREKARRDQRNTRMVKKRRDIKNDVEKAIRNKDLVPPNFEDSEQHGRATKVFQLDKAWLRVQQQDKLREANVKREEEKKEKQPKGAAETKQKVESTTKGGESFKSSKTLVGGQSTHQNGPPTTTSRDENFSFKVAEQASLTRQTSTKKSLDKDTTTMPGFTPTTPGKKGNLNQSTTDGQDGLTKEVIPQRKCELVQQAFWWVWNKLISIWKHEKSKDKQSEREEDDVCQCCGNPDPKGDLYKFRYSLLDDAKTLGHLGRGYGMYYAFMKDLNMVLMILTVFVSVIIICLTAIYMRNDGKSFKEANSIVELLTLKGLLQDVNSTEYQPQAVSVFITINIAGIIYLMVHSIFQRRKLVKMKHDLDKDKDAPSSYALLVRQARIIDEEDDDDDIKFRWPMDKWQIQKKLIDKYLKDSQIVTWEDEILWKKSTDQEEYQKFEIEIDDYEYEESQSAQKTRYDMHKDIDASVVQKPNGDIAVARRFQNPVEYVSYCFDCEDLLDMKEQHRFLQKERNAVKNSSNVLIYKVKKSPIKYLTCRPDKRTKEQIIDELDDIIIPLEKEIQELETFFQEYSSMLNNPKRRAYYYRDDDYLGYKNEFRKRLNDETLNKQERLSTLKFMNKYQQGNLNFKKKGALDDAKEAKKDEAIRKIRETMEEDQGSLFSLPCRRNKGILKMQMDRLRKLKAKETQAERLLKLQQKKYEQKKGRFGKIMEEFFWNYILPQCSYEEKQAKFNLLKYEKTKEQLKSEYRVRNVQFRGNAIVVLKTQRTLREILEKQQEKSGPAKFWDIFFKKQDIEIAPDPTDLIWENMNVKRLDRIRNVIISMTCTILMSLICLGAIYGLNVAKPKEEPATSANPNVQAVDPSISNVSFESKLRDAESKYRDDLISFVIGILIPKINRVLTVVTERLTEFEKHETKTANNLSTAIKLTISKFANTSLVPVLVNLTLNEWNLNSRLIQDMFNIMMGMAIYEPVQQFLNIDGLLKVKGMQIFQKHIKRKSSRLTQEESNIMYEGEELDMADIFSEAANLFLTAALFQPVLPLALPIAFAGFLITYWVNKYKLLYRVKRPDEMSDLLPMFFANLVPMIAFLWALSMALFYNKGLKTYMNDDQDNDDYQIPIWITLGFAFLFNIVPISAMISKSFDTTKYTGIGARYYDQLVMSFRSDYIRENPVTKKLGLMNFLFNLTKDVDDTKKGAGGKKPNFQQLVAINNFINSAAVKDSTSDATKKLVQNAVESGSVPAEALNNQASGHAEQLERLKEQNERKKKKIRELKELKRQIQAKLLASGDNKASQRKVEEDSAEDDDDYVSDGGEEQARKDLLKEIDDLVANKTKLSNEVKKIKNDLEREKLTAKNAKDTLDQERLDFDKQIQKITADFSVNPRYGPGLNVHKKYGNQPKYKQLDLAGPSIPPK